MRALASCFEQLFDLTPDRSQRALQSRARQVAISHLMPEREDFFDLLEQCLSDLRRFTTTINKGLKISRQMCPTDLPPARR